LKVPTHALLPSSSMTMDDTGTSRMPSMLGKMRPS
jgi:hypothetical protein